MAKRRMFSIDVVGQDAFLDMPTEARELYFQLGMYADDEGFVSPKKVMRVVGASDDTIKLLVAKSFIHPFKTGVIVITHWNQNNYIQNDRFTPTTFTGERKELEGICIQIGYKLDTQGGREVRKKEKGFSNIDHAKTKPNQELEYDPSTNSMKPRA